MRGDGLHAYLNVVHPNARLSKVSSPFGRRNPTRLPSLGVLIPSAPMVLIFTLLPTST